jgi:hypothetical protein
MVCPLKHLLLRLLLHCLEFHYCQLLLLRQPLDLQRSEISHR